MMITIERVRCDYCRGNDAIVKAARSNGRLSCDILTDASGLGARIYLRNSLVRLDKTYHFVVHVKDVNLGCCCPSKGLTS